MSGDAADDVVLGNPNGELKGARKSISFPRRLPLNLSRHSGGRLTFALLIKGENDCHEGKAETVKTIVSLNKRETEKSVSLIRTEAKSGAAGPTA